MRKAIGQVAGLALTGAVPAMAAPQGDLSVTIYNNDCALVQDSRLVDLAKGRQTVAFPAVSAAIRPETVTLAAADAAVVEQNFDYDLLSPDRLMDKAVGQSVRVVRTDPRTGAETSEPGIVLANNGGALISVGGRIEVLGQAPNTRVVFDHLPEGLSASPTLSVTLDSARGGARPVTLTYLSRGFSWKADYVALFDDAAGKVDVEGWVTLHNASGTTFDAARVLLVAGSVGGDSEPLARPGRIGMVAGVEPAKREQLGDFTVYPLAGRTTLADQQQKQVSFLDVKGAEAHRSYMFRNDHLDTTGEPRGADSVLHLSTARQGGLGDALPGGTVRVYMRDARGQPQFVGESPVPHTPAGSALALRTGEAFDVKGEASVVRRETIDSGEWQRSARWRIVTGQGAQDAVVDRARKWWRTTMHYHLTNARNQPVTVDVVQAGLDSATHDTRVPHESQPGEQRNSDERVWHVAVPAHGAADLEVQIDQVQIDSAA